MTPLQGNYVSSGRFMRDCDYENALKYWGYARSALRWNRPNEHGYWMRKAIRYWRYYAAYVREHRDAA